MPFYLDSSALVKFVIQEPESTALREWSISVGQNVVTSSLGKTEMLRVVRRWIPARLANAEAVLRILPQLTLTSSMFDIAAELEPATLRTLDALHLACALTLGDELAGIVTYDSRFAEAARAIGIQVIAPA